MVTLIIKIQERIVFKRLMKGVDEKTIAMTITTQERMVLKRPMKMVDMIVLV